jgi:hypothetical protein
MTEKAKRGEPCSIPPFGYEMKNKQLIPHEEESKIIKQVFEWYDSGVGMLRIAKNLNELGVRTHRGNKIENRTVEYWLNNPVYVGKIRWTPTGAINRNYHNPDSLIVDASHEPLINNELWERVGARMKNQKERYRKYHKPSDKISHWLVGLTRCGVCGGPLVNCGGYLYCNNRSKGTCPGNGSISVHVMEEYIFNYLTDVVNKKINVDVPSELTGQSNADAAVYRAQLKRAEQRMARVKDAYENGIDTLAEYRENKLKIQTEIDDITAKIQQACISPKIDENELVSKLIDKILQAIDVLQDNNVDAKRKNTIAREFISAVVKTGTDGRTINIRFLF